MQKNNVRDKIISKLKESQNILITVSSNPNLDELAAALGLTLALNKAEKHATAVVSSVTPEVLSFLNPNKTFENSVDSLRDFIIALNKEKADHLRYKLVGDHVKIFITPFRSVITENDLEFEQGDFNIDFVIALGVSNKEHLDSALAAHGRIFHDAGVSVLTVGEKASELSELNWHEPEASSISELALELIESASIGKKTLTKSAATAILTGIIAETDRFSNNKTSAKVMSLASRLITAGADQQLIVSKLKQSEDIAIRKELETQAKAVKENEEAEREAESIPKAEESTSSNDSSVLTIERPQQTEDELEPYTQELSNNEGTPQTQNDNINDVKNLAVEFPAVETPINNQPLFTVTDRLPIEAPIQFEETPVENSTEGLDLPIEQPITTGDQTLEIGNNPEELILENNIQTENYIPDMPVSTPNFDQNTEFVNEAPIEAEKFEPTQQISTYQEPQPPTPKFGPREYVGDDYYNPEAVRNFTQEIAENPEILSHSSEITPQVINPVGGKTQVNTPEVFQQSEQQFMPTSQQVSDFSSTIKLPPELPPIPNFENIDFNGIPMPPLPPEQPNELIQAQSEFNAEQPDVALGSNASSQVMTDQVYQDPSQFRIPGIN